MSALPFPWLPAEFPPAADPDAPLGLSIECVGVVVRDECGSRLAEIVSYWPARRIWTMTTHQGGEWTDVEVNVSHYFEVPELPELMEVV